MRVARTGPDGEDGEDGEGGIILYQHQCGRQLWLEFRDHGGSVPVFWNQGETDNFARMMRCPCCEDKLPDSVGSWRDAVEAGELVPAENALVTFD